MARKQKRWMKSVIETSKSDMPTLPWSRAKRAERRAQRLADQPKARRAS